MNIITKIRIWNVRRQIKAAMVERAGLPDKVQAEIDSANKSVQDHIRALRQHEQLRRCELGIRLTNLKNDLDELRGIRRMSKPLEIDELGAI